MAEFFTFPGWTAAAGAFAAGIVLGLLFFGGLRMTMKFIDRARNPALLVLASFVFRFLLLFGGLALLVFGAGGIGLLLGTAGLTAVLIATTVAAATEGGESRW